METHSHFKRHILSETENAWRSGDPENNCGVKRSRIFEQTGERECIRPSQALGKWSQCGFLIRSILLSGLGSCNIYLFSFQSRRVVGKFRTLFLICLPFLSRNNHHFNMKKFYLLYFTLFSFWSHFILFFYEFSILFIIHIINTSFFRFICGSVCV